MRLCACWSAKSTRTRTPNAIQVGTSSVKSWTPALPGRWANGCFVSRSLDPERPEYRQARRSSSTDSSTRADTHLNTSPRRCAVTLFWRPSKRAPTGPRRHRSRSRLSRPKGVRIRAATPRGCSSSCGSASQVHGCGWCRHRASKARLSSPLPASPGCLLCSSAPRRERIHTVSHPCASV